MAQTFENAFKIYLEHMLTVTLQVSYQKVIQRMAFPILAREIFEAIHNQRLDDKTA